MAYKNSLSIHLLTIWAPEYNPYTDLICNPININSNNFFFLEYYI